MATAIQAIARIAEATGILPATVFRTGRELREAGSDLWPQGSQGRGREAQVEPHHLVNLTLGLAAADPITNAPKVVMDYRALVAMAPLITEAERASSRTTLAKTKPSCEGILAPRLATFGHTLGLQLDGWVRILQEPEFRQFREKLRLACPTLTLIIDPVPKARIELRLDRFVIGNSPKEIDNYTLSQKPSPMPPAAMLHEVTIPFDLIELLADLWTDTLVHRSLRKIHAETPKAPLR